MSFDLGSSAHYSSSPGQSAWCHGLSAHCCSSSKELVCATPCAPSSLSYANMFKALQSFEEAVAIGFPHELKNIFSLYFLFYGSPVSTLVFKNLSQRQ